MRPTIERLHELIDADFLTGELRWAIDRTWRFHKGDICGSVRKDGFRMISIDYCRTYAHIIIWAMRHGRWPEYEIGHINGKRDDNRIENLIDRPRKDHHLNITKPRRGSKSGLLGVAVASGRKKAYIAFAHDRAHAITQDDFGDPLEILPFDELINKLDIKSEDMLYNCCNSIPHELDAHKGIGAA